MNSLKMWMCSIIIIVFFFLVTAPLWYKLVIFLLFFLFIIHRVMKALGMECSNSADLLQYYQKL